MHRGRLQLAREALQLLDPRACRLELLCDDGEQLRLGVLATLRLGTRREHVSHLDQLPVHDRGATAGLWWVGAHGGSGESTLAALMPGTQAAGHAWPRTPSQTPARTVLVARGDARGLRAAQDAMRQWAAGLVPSVEVLGLVVMADAPGRVPRSLRDLLQVVSGGVPRTWSVPWVEAWRVGEPPALSSSPREVQRLVDELTAILGAAGTTN